MSPGIASEVTLSPSKASLKMVKSPLNGDGKTSDSTSTMADRAGVNTVPALKDTKPVAFSLDTMEDALQDFADGKFLVVVDDEDRENEGDLIIAGGALTTEKMAFLIKWTSGLICVPMSAERLDQLQLPLMVPNNTEKLKTAYTISVDYKDGTTTGISAHDRALTVKKLADVENVTDPAAFSRPGHIFPLRAVANGVLARIGHTEAAVDLCRLTGQAPVAAICELVNPNDPLGGMARRDDCRRFADQFGLKMISIEQMQQYRRERNV